MNLNTLTLSIESPHVYTAQGVAVSVTGTAQHLIFRLSLNTMTLHIESPNVYTQFGVAISVTGVAQVKIQGSNQDMLASACELFLGKSEAQIRNVAQETLEGHQRAIMGNMTVEEIYKDRKKFSKAVFEVASSDLVNMGIFVVSYTITDIRDSEGYLHALGMKRTAEVKSAARIGEAEAKRDAGIKGYLKSLGLARTAQVKRDARIGEAEARRDAGIKEAIAEEARMTARYANDVEIAKAQRDFELKKAHYDLEIQTKAATSELAYDLQAAKTKQAIKEEQMQIKVIERSQQIQLQEQEITRRERELDAQIRKPAEAEKFRLEKIAEANRKRIVLEAEAEAESVKLRGDAEAYSIEAKAKAEAEQMAKKADAWKDYQDAAMVDMILETLPKIAAEISAPLTNCKKITMVSSGKEPVGASKVAGEVLDIMEKIPHVVESLTGINISKNIKAATRR
ncbi:FLOT [Mytilus edulis]|uniref:FLOT n=1 Tax=Mytilus edulis TaxID=6550 RepID=A0A8S3UFP1_MYTED|nr:FLOT [Mytilus edulis]